jgi:hypothetical protein
VFAPDLPVATPTVRSALQLLRLASELHPLQLGQQQFQMLDLTLPRLQPLRGRAIALVDFHQERAQRFRIQRI